MTLHNYHHLRQQNIAAVKTGKPWHLLGHRRKNDQMICFAVNDASLKTPPTPCSPSPPEWLCTSPSGDGVISFSPTGFQLVTDTQCLSLAVCASAWLCSRIDSFIGAICQQAFDDNRPWCGGADPSGSPLYRPRCHFDEAEVIMSLCACACEYAVAVCVSYSALSLHYRFNLPTIYTHTRLHSEFVDAFLWTTAAAAFQSSVSLALRPLAFHRCSNIQPLLMKLGIYLHKRSRHKVPQPLYLALWSISLDTLNSQQWFWESVVAKASSVQSQ